MAATEPVGVGEDDHSRYRSVTDEDTYTFIEDLKNSNTKRKTISDCKIFTNWLKSENEIRNLEDIPAADLDNYLARFFLAVRNQKQEEYEPDSIKLIQASINRYLTEKCNINIFKDREFTHSRDVLMAKRKQLKSKGMGNKKGKLTLSV